MQRPLSLFLQKAREKGFFFVISPIKSIPFLKFSQDHLWSTLGITCGRGLFVVHFGDHLRSRDHLQLGIICGTVQQSKLPPTITFAIACTFSDNLSRNSCIFTGLSLRAGGRGFPRGYYECGPRLLLLENKRKIEPKEFPSCLTPLLLVYPAT